MPIGDIAVEALGSVARFIGQVIAEVFIDLVICGPGYLICRVFGYRGEPDGWLPAVVGLLFWATVLFAAYWLFAAGAA